MPRSLVILLAAAALLAGGCVSNPLKPAEPSAGQAAAASTTADSKDYRTVKSRDGSFDGEIWGKPARNSQFASLQIGMSQAEVENRIGHGSDMKSYVTGKAWIPFYFGTDGHRFETYYKGQGSLIYTGGGIGGGRGVLIGINHDASEDGYQ